MCHYFELCIIALYILTNYGIHAWGSACKTELGKILILQKKAVRAMTGNRWYQTYGNPGPLASSDPLFKNLGILKVEDIYKLNIGKLIFSSLSHLSPPLFWNWFTINNQKVTRSNTIIYQEDYFDVGEAVPTITLLRKPCKKESYGAKMVQVLGPVLWNELPGSVRDSDSLLIFKKCLIKVFLSSYKDE